MGEQKAPRLCPNIVPKAHRSLDLRSMCATAEQKQAVEGVLQQHKKARR